MDNDIKEWFKAANAVNAYDESKFSIINGKINYNDTVILGDEVKFPFNRVDSFIMTGDVKTLANFPSEILYDLYIYSAELTSLEGSPRRLKGGYIVKGGKFTSLRGISEKVGSLIINDSDIVNLKYFPTVERHVDISENKLTSLKGIKKVINGDLTCHTNELSIVEELPERVNGMLDISNNKFTSLKGIHRVVKSAQSIVIGNNPIVSNILGLLLIKGLKEIKLIESTSLENTSLKDLRKAVNILNKYLTGNKSDMISAQTELIENNLDDYAMV